MRFLAKILIRYILGFSIFLLPLLVQGQIGSEKEVDSTGRYIPKAIKVVNIIQKVEEANEELKLTTKRTSSDDNVKRIDTLFPTYAKFIAAQKKRKDHFVEPK